MQGNVPTNGPLVHAIGEEQRFWPFLSRLWIITLVLAIVVMLIGLEMAIFGFFPGLSEPVRIQDTAMLFVLSAAILFVLSFITGFGHELMRMERFAPRMYKQLVEEGELL